MNFQLLNLIGILILTENCNGIFYAANSSHVFNGSSCIIGNEILHPCMTLEALGTHLIIENNDNASIYFVEENYYISQMVSFIFPNLNVARLRPWRNGSQVNIFCVSGDLLFSYSGVTSLTLEGLHFHQCGRSKPVITLNSADKISQVVKITNTTFIKSKYTSIKVMGDLAYMLVKNCLFMDNAADSFYFTSSATPTHATLWFQECAFVNNTGSAIAVHKYVNVSIVDSAFHNHSNTPIWMELDIFFPQIDISYHLRVNNSEFITNTAQIAGVMYINCPCIVQINHSIFVGNSAENEGGVASFSGKAVSLFNCTFLNNSANRGSGGVLSTSKHSQSTSFEVKKCNFINNRATVGGVFYAKSDYTIFHMCNFTGNMAEAYGGALSIAGYGRNKLFLNECSFENNTARFGGALNIDDVDMVTVQDCKFMHNEAKDEAGALRIANREVTSELSYVIIQLNVFFDNYAQQGGAIQIKNILRISLSYCNFLNNTAMFGGALQAIASSYGRWIVASLSLNESTFMHNKANVSGGAISYEGYNITVDGSLFQWNQANEAGGAIRVNFSCEEKYLDRTTSEMIIMGSLFSNNSAFIGGALKVDNQKIKIYLFEVNFIENEALNEGGAASFNIYSAIKEFVIQNCTFAYNRVRIKLGKGGAFVTRNEELQLLSSNFLHNEANHGGAIFLQNTSIFMIGCTFVKNKAAFGGALLSNFTSISATNSNFYQNLASDFGGGIALLDSHINFSKNSKLIENKVESKYGQGGGIYVKDKKKDCKINSCLIFWTGHAMVDFSNNYAKRGPMIYGGMLDRCRVSQNKSMLPPAEVLYSNSTRYEVNSYGVTSDGIKFCYCERLTPDCSLREIDRNLFPGQTLNIYVACVDQMEQPVPCDVKSEYQDTEFQLGQGQSVQHIDTCEKLNFNAYTKTKTITTLTIRGEILCDQSIWNTLRVNISIRQCPKGFVKTIDRCQCDNRLQIIFRNVECDIDASLVKLKEVGWFDYDKDYLRIHNNCPLNYCSFRKNGTKPSDPDAQCNNNHGGILCGGCIANHSVVLGSWKCMKCSHLSKYNFIWLTVVIALAGVVLVALLLFLKMTISSGSINGLIIYANVVSLSGLLDYQPCSLHPVLRTFLSWLNLDLGIELCFYSGMDVYQKTWLQFVFPFYIWLLVGVIIVLCRYSSTVMKLMGMRNIEVLATLFLLSYAKLLKTIIAALSFTDILVASASTDSDTLIPRKVWLYDGKINFLSREHLPLFVISILCLFLLFLPCTLFLTFGQCIRSLQNWRILKWTQNAYFVYIIDAYHAPYKRRYRFWTGLGLLIRCILFTIFGTSYRVRSNLFWIVFAVVFILAIRVCIGSSVYSNKMVDLLEVFFVINLGVLAVVLHHNNALCEALTTSVSLSFVVFVCMLICHLHLEMNKSCQVYTQFIKKVQNMITIKKMPLPLYEEHEDIIPSRQLTSPSTAIFDLRETLLSN